MAAGFFDPSKMSAARALLMAEQAYARCYEKQLCLAQLDSQGAATALLSCAVNEGLHQAVVLFQKALLAAGARIVADGAMGPGTVAAANALPPQKIVNGYADLQIVFYEDDARENPSQACFLRGWLNRVQQWRTVCLA